MESDRGIISGFTGVAIHMTIQHILQHMHIANRCNRCKKELAVLKELVMSIELTILHIQQNRLVFKTEKVKEDEASAVNGWLNTLDDLLLKASKIVQHCSIPESRAIFSGFQLRKKICDLNKDIREHLALSPLLVRVPEGQVVETQKVLEGLGQTKDRVEALASSATTAETARKNLMVSDTQKVLEGLRQTKDRVEALASSATTALSEMGDALDNCTIEKKEPYIVGEIQKVLKGLGQTKDRVQKVLEGLGQTKVLEGLGQTKDRVKALASSATTALSEMGDALDNCTIEKKVPYIVGEIQKVLEGLGQTKDRVEALASSATTALSEMGDALDNCTIENKEPYIVGQCQAFKKLQELLIADVKPKNIGVFGNRGSGKTLLLKTVFKSEEVRTHFSEGLILWLTASQKISFSSPVNELSLRNQIAIQKDNLDLIKDIKKEDTEEEWLNQQLQGSSRFVLFLDDVCEKNATRLLEELGISQSVSQHSNSIVIASYRDPNALSESGIADGDSIKILPLDRDHSWELFKHHAFPYNEGNVPSNKDVENLAKLVCEKCGGFPLAIKVVGRAMAGSTHPQQWEWALHSLLKATQDTTENSGPRATQDTIESRDTTESSGPRATQETTESSGPRATQETTESRGSRSIQETGQPLNACLRLSLDALSNKDFNLHLCFLSIAASFPEGAIIDAQEVIPLWIGEGLLARKVLEHVPQHKVLADCRLIEPMIRNTEGRPVCLRMQDPFELGRIYLDLLAERCLIEPTARDACGRVLCFRMLKVVHDWAILIAKEEENFYHCVDNGLEVLQNDGSSKIKRIFLSGNKLSSFPQFSSPSASMCSLLISQNKELKIISQKMFRSMLSLKVLDLSGTSAASLPEGVGRLKQLRCLKLSGMPIKRLPKSLTALGYLEILDVSFTSIEELPSDIHLLRSLRYLSLRGCTKLQYLPCDISGLLSLQYLYLDGCNKLTETPSSRCKKVASLHSLFDLIQLKKFALALQNNSKQTIREGTLGSMTELDTLLLALPEMKSLPLDMNNLSKLRSLSLKCSKLVKMDSFIFSGEIEKKNDVTNLKHLTYLKFYECGKLENFQHLHKLQNLRQLEIILCPKVTNFPNEFGLEDAFPFLEIFSLVGLQNLKELPKMEGGAMPSLRILNIMDCPQLKILPGNYLNNSRMKIRVYCRSQVYAAEVNAAAVVNAAANRNLVQVVSMSTSTEEIIKKYLQAFEKKEDWLSGEFWCNELFLFVEGLITLA